ncbi:MAG: chorismate synthase [Bacteroidia bacterium]|nr:chorismate synthase [Bacteroidia bacterium]MBP7260500.1 chorismate synthase [Bacteroidia bacterium]MBP9179557.1 chorismate synthase [Bacteroidia bacterium]MBP9724035.1 chorismate synthase [Bacteroidia bacterium]
MGSNSFGKNFTVTSFGESHGSGVGVVIDGCPAGLGVDESFIAAELSRRKTAQTSFASSRNEKDEFQILSGVFEGKSTGAPITIFIPNTDARPKDYETIKDKFRPSHADFTYETKYGVRDYRGGGRSSARITAGWVAAGAIAKLLLIKQGINIKAYVSQIGEIQLQKKYTEVNLSETDNSLVCCPDKETSTRMSAYLDEIKTQGDTCGGVITGVILNTTVGLGEPLFDKLQANLAKAMLSLNAVKGFEYGSGFAAAAMRGSEHNDAFMFKEGKITTTTNFSGGIQGGISNGSDIYFRVAFKPVATIMLPQESVNNKGEDVVMQLGGRHDACVVPRAVPIVEALSALVVADAFLLNKLSKLE